MCFNLLSQVFIFLFFMYEVKDISQQKQDTLYYHLNRSITPWTYFIKPSCLRSIHVGIEMPLPLCLRALSIYAYPKWEIMCLDGKVYSALYVPMLSSLNFFMFEFTFGWYWGRVRLSYIRQNGVICLDIEVGELKFS